MKRIEFFKSLIGMAVAAPIAIEAISQIKEPEPPAINGAELILYIDGKPVTAENPIVISRDLNYKGESDGWGEYELGETWTIEGIFNPA